MPNPLQVGDGLPACCFLGLPSVERDADRYPRQSLLFDSIDVPPDELQLLQMPDEVVVAESPRHHHHRIGRYSVGQVDGRKHARHSLCGSAEKRRATGLRFAPLAPLARVGIVLGGVWQFCDYVPQPVVAGQKRLRAVICHRRRASKRLDDCDTDILQCPPPRRQNRQCAQLLVVHGVLMVAIQTLVVDN
jgi:hypothetical protein